MSIESINLAAFTATQQGRWSDAAQLYSQILDLNPHLRDVYLDLAFCLQQQKQYQQAIEVCERALAVDPSFAEAMANIGSLYRLMARWADSVTYLEKATQLAPKHPAIWNSLGTAYKQVGRSDDSLRAFRRAEELAPRASFGSNILYTELFVNPEDAQRLKQLHIEWANRYATPELNRFNFAGRDRTESRKLRIGYVSAYFRNHAVNYFVQPILLAHDRNAVEVFCYSDVENPDALTKQIQPLVNWRDCASLSDEQLADAIDRDRIDILIDLTGHIAKNRLLVFARKPAPITVTYIGYQFTTGLPNMDYRLTDAIADPHNQATGETDALYTEKLWRLPTCFFCFMPSASSPPVGPLPAERNGFITFGCQNNFAKISARTLAAWKNVLTRIPESRLALLGSDDPETRAMLGAQLGDAVSRVQLLGWASRRDYLARYAQIDIALDPIPFNGHTTTCDALWCGVPVVTRLGSQYASRYGSSALFNLGLSDLAATSDEEYVEIAVRLANDRARLQELHATLRAKMNASPVCDAIGFTRRLEAAYREMWRTFLLPTGAHPG